MGFNGVPNTDVFYGPPTLSAFPNQSSQILSPSGPKPSPWTPKLSATSGPSSWLTSGLRKYKRPFSFTWSEKPQPLISREKLISPSLTLSYIIWRFPNGWGHPHHPVVMDRLVLKQWWRLGVPHDLAVSALQGSALLELLWLEWVSQQFFIACGCVWNGVYPWKYLL